MSRIIAGRAGGRRLVTPAGDRTRPTTDRVREALFSSLATWLGSGEAGAAAQLDGLAVLDLFAGSGAIGLEAKSRGARRVVLVERDAATARIAQRNASTTGLDVQVLTMAAEAFVASGDERFDVIAADPPYAYPARDLEALIGRLFQGRLAPDGILVIERSARDPAPAWPPGTVSWSKRYGETMLHYARSDTQED